MSLFQDWTQEHLTPIIKINETGVTITVSYFATWTNTWVGLPEIGSLYPGDLIQYSDLVLSDIDIRNRPGGEFASITLSYRSPQRGSEGRSSEVKNGATVYTLEDGGLEKAISSHPGYLAIWDHHLANKIGTSQAAPSLDSTNTDISPAAGQTTNDWMWVKDLSEVGGNWEVKPGNKKIKQGIDAYIVGAPVVRRKSYYDSQVSANSAAASVGSRATPANTFGKTGEWLVVSASVYYEDPFWVADLAYQSGIVDTTIYP